jgi:hypothetical protein
VKVTGTITNGFRFDLTEVSLFVFDRVYRLEGGLPAGKSVDVSIREIDNGILPGEWRDRTDADRPETAQGRYDPGRPLRSLLFHERFDPSLQRHNHLFRKLDWSWRLTDDPRVAGVSVTSLGTREAILVGRAARFDTHSIQRHFQWPAPSVAQPTSLDPIHPIQCMGKVIYGPERRISQDTYVRAIVPLRPQP